MTNTHTPHAALEAARNHYAASLAAHDHLQELYDNAARTGERVDPAKAAQLHDAVRFGLKAGELAASIAIASDLVDAATTRDRITASTAGRTSARVRTLDGRVL